MLFLLPPSETKRTGGEGALALASLGYPELASGRRAALAALEAAVDAGQDASTPARQRAAAANAAVRTSGAMPAIRRYTGVLFDGLDVDSMEPDARAWVARHVAIGSALFGLVRAEDPVPDYKVSHDTKLPGVTLRRLWREHAPVRIPGLVVDMRSKAYAALLPVEGAVPLEVVDEHGVALSHWNKHGKGTLVRQLADAGIEAEHAPALAETAAGHGIPLAHDGTGLTLVTERPAPAGRRLR